MVWGGHRGCCGRAGAAEASRALREDSKKWEWGARKLNLMQMWRMYMPVVFVVVLVLFLLYFFVL